jgi:hypothetical protein
MMPGLALKEQDLESRTGKTQSAHEKRTIKAGMCLRLNNITIWSALTITKTGNQAPEPAHHRPGVWLRASLKLGSLWRGKIRKAGMCKKTNEDLNMCSSY